MRNSPFSLVSLQNVCFSPSTRKIFTSVSGKITDAEDKSPIKDVKIFLVDGEKNTYWSDTNEKGEFRIKSVKPGIGKIGFFPPPPYVWEKEENEMQQFIIEPGKNIVFFKKLVHGGSIELTLIDASVNVPLEGFDVNVMGASIGLQTRKYWQPTDKEGKYRIAQLTGGKYKLILDKDGWGMKVIPDVEIRLKETTAMTIQYNAPGSSKLEGVVKCEKTGELLTDIFVGVNRIGKYGWAHSYTDDKGRYTFLDLEPGKYKVKVFGLKDKINDAEHTVYIRKEFEFGKYCNPVINFSVDCSLYFQKKWELSWYKK